MTIRYERGCGLEGLEGLPRASVDLILTDPPSGDTDAPFDHCPDLDRFWVQVWRVLKPKGTAVVFASSMRFAAKLLQYRFFRYDLVWEKNLATGFLNAKKMPMRSHEFVLVYGRGAGNYTPQMVEGHAAINVGAGRSQRSMNWTGKSQPSNKRNGATDRFPKSVIAFKVFGTSARGRVHVQQKPEPLLRWLIRSYSKPGNLVVDPFSGSGSTLKAAQAEGRRAMGWERDLVNFHKAKGRFAR